MQARRVAALLTGAALLLSACSQGPPVGRSTTTPTDSSTARPAQTQVAEQAPSVSSSAATPTNTSTARPAKTLLAKQNPCDKEREATSVKYLTEWAEAINAYDDMEVVRFLGDLGGCDQWLLEVYWEPKSGVFLTEETAHQAMARIISHLPPYDVPMIMIVLSSDRLFKGWRGPVYIVQGTLDELRQLAREGRKAFPKNIRILWTYFDR